MTRGSKSLRFVIKAAFHLSPFLNLRLLYPHRMSMTVKNLAFWNFGLWSQLKVVDQGLADKVARCATVYKDTNRV